MSPTTEKKLAFDLTSENKLQHYEIDRLNPLVILSESIKYLKKNEILPIKITKQEPKQSAYHGKKNEEPNAAKGKHLDKMQVASLYCNAYETSQEEG